MEEIEAEATVEWEQRFIDRLAERVGDAPAWVQLVDRPITGHADLLRRRIEVGTRGRQGPLAFREWLLAHEFAHLRRRCPSNSEVVVYGLGLSSVLLVPGIATLYYTVQGRGVLAICLLLAWLLLMSLALAGDAAMHRRTERRVDAQAARWGYALLDADARAHALNQPQCDRFRWLRATHPRWADRIADNERIVAGLE